MFGDRGDCDPAFLTWLEAVKTHQDNSAVKSTLAEDELTEILVRGDEHATFSRCRLQNVLVYESWALLSHIRDIVTGRSKSFNDLTVDPFVAGEPQVIQVGSG